ncbi:MAG: hypothetical protein OEQ12_05765 [Nitrosopumilus sp.]|nr:hypothetical protein [Nitrosopumilus sp.]
MEFEPIDHLVCTMANKRKTTLKELMNVTKENADVLTNLINYGISKNILTTTKKKLDTFYTLTPYGEEQLAVMSSKIIEGWKAINKAVETKDVDTFLKMVKENELWIKYLRYAKIISADDADFIIDTYKKIIKSRQKKKTKDPEIRRIQTDAEMERTRVLTEQQWKFDDQNYEITRDFNNYVDTNYDNNY